MGVPINYLYGRATRDASSSVTNIHAVERTLTLEEDQTMDQMRDLLNETQHTLRFNVLPSSDAQSKDNTEGYKFECATEACHALQSSDVISLDGAKATYASSYPDGEYRLFVEVTQK